MYELQEYPTTTPIGRRFVEPGNHRGGYLPLGEFTGYKKVLSSFYPSIEHPAGIYIIAKLLIPAQADRLITVGGKCRSDIAIVKAFYDYKQNLLPAVTEAYSIFNRYFVYELGKHVFPDSFDMDPRIDCSHGIHFFLSFAEAVNY